MAEREGPAPDPTIDPVADPVPDATIDPTIDPAADPTIDPAIDPLIWQLARAVVKHPIAAQAAYRALVREGRAFAQTEEGRRLRRQLAGSELVGRLRTGWELVTLGMLHGDAAPGAIPSVLVEALVRAVLRDRFEARLHDALRRGASEAG